MKLASAALFVALLTACGNNNNNNNSSCSSTHECINGDCECTTSGVSGQSCSETTCQSECEVCTS